MSRLFSKRIAWAFFSLAVFFVSCAGGPASTASGAEPLTVTVSSEAEVKAAYGYTYATNPFLEPPGLFSREKTTFIVVRFLASSPVNLEIAGAEIAGAEGRIKTRVYGKEELRTYWETKTVDDGSQTTDAKSAKRFAAIDRYALDLYGPNKLRKNSPYSLLVMGPGEGDIGEAELIVRYYVDGVYEEKTFPVSF